MIFIILKVYRMGVGSAMNPAASLMKLHMQLHGGNCVDIKALALVLSQWWEDILREVCWSCKGVGITLGSKTGPGRV